jgi:hypothetical protein
VCSVEFLSFGFDEFGFSSVCKDREIDGIIVIGR